MRYLFLALALFIALPAQAGKTPPKIFLRIHIQTTGDGLAAEQAHTIAVPPNGDLIQIRTMPEVTEQDLVGVMPQPGGTRLYFDHRGQVNLDAVTAQNQGRILVVLLNGYVIYAPVIDGEIDNGQLLLPHPLAPQIVQLLKDVAIKNLKTHTKS